LLVQRLITAALGIPLVVLVIWVGDALLPAVVAAAVFVAVIEFGAARGTTRAPLTLLAAAAAAVMPLAALAGEEYLLGAFVGTLLLVSAAFTLTRDPHADVERWLWGLVSALYFGGLAAYFVLLREVENGRDWVFFMVLTVWITDTGAYVVGRAIGRHKLAPAISPGKTIEGSAGSLVAGFAAVFGLNEAFGLDLAVVHLVALGLLLPAVIMLGDLAESAMKRALGVKDSSGLVPGHGGVADRLDSLLFAAPAVYYYLKWIVF
jgi:phosphatidate cytidylyltransferase